jgi:hypothetical protein
MESFEAGLRLDFVDFVAAEYQFFLAKSYGNYHKSATERRREKQLTLNFRALQRR